MEGVTNVARHLAAVAADPRRPAVVGLCDAPEVRFVVGALRRRGHDVATRDDLAAHGFHVCDDDLEDELIRAVGVDVVVDVVAAQGELPRLDTFRRQPAQRGRPLHDQLHRFAGTTSGRKARFAAALAERVAPDRVPAPLRLVLEAAHDAVVRPVAGPAGAGRAAGTLGRTRQGRPQTSMPRTQRSPASPPQASHATRPGDGKPFVPRLKPSACLSTEWRAKYAFIFFTSASETVSPSASWWARRRPTSVKLPSGPALLDPAHRPPSDLLDPLRGSSSCRHPRTVGRRARVRIPTAVSPGRGPGP